MPRPSRPRRLALSLLTVAALLPASAHAQYIGGNAPPPPPPPAAGQTETPEAALARNVRLLAINPKDYQALVGAGRSALRLGDSQAAIGFFGRAEEVHPTSWEPKAGQASALVQMMEPQAALGYFEEAQRLGASQGTVALDRGLAFDLAGDQGRAQADYRVALSGSDPNEARRRLALSLAIAGNRAEALTTLDPLLARRDPAAARNRAFILALTGDPVGARTAVNAVMPSIAGSMDPFFRRLATLGSGQKAAAVHFGVMPAEGVQLAAADDLPAPAPAAARPEPAPAPPPVRVSVAAPPRQDRLADIETALGRIPEPPPAPRPLIERVNSRIKTRADVTAERRDKASVSARKLASAAAAKSPLASKKDREEGQGKASAKAKAQDKDGAETPAAASRSRVWVQLAGGARAERMPAEFARLRAKKPSLFSRRTAHVAELKGWSRLLVGPFKNDEEAQDFVNDLHAADLDGFVWTNPATQQVEKLAAK